MCGSTAGVGKNFADRERGEFGAEMDDFVGERCMGNKNFPTLTKINLGDASTRGELDPHTLVDR